MTYTSRCYERIPHDNDQTLSSCRGKRASQNRENKVDSSSPESNINPRPAPLFEKTEEIPNRLAFCRNYDRCLDFAIVRQWNSFTCEECNHYEFLQYSPQKWLEDNLKCMDLIDHLWET